MRRTGFERRVLAAVIVCAAVAACEAEPSVIVGRAKESATNAGRSAEIAGRGGDHGDDHEDEEQDVDLAEHECSEIEPVCGRDGMTYQNACQATNAGVQVARRGAC